jgi:hypothetical protein
MSIEGQGRMDTIVKVITALIATHPEKDKVIRSLDVLLQAAGDSESDNANVKAYKLGVRRTVERPAKGTKRFAHVEQIHDLKPRPNSH